MINFADRLARVFANVECRNQEDDCILYALVLEIHEPKGNRHSNSVNEGSDGSVALPSFVNGLGMLKCWAKYISTGITQQRIVYGGRGFTLQAQLLNRATLMYRLSGDKNTLYADPDIATKAGFERPILHGLCTMEIAAWSIPMVLLDGDFAALTHQEVNFSAHVYPGETIRTEIWEDGDIISFWARVPERDVIVLNNGRVRLN
ncbi:MAG: MaoC/PaaZ C-terminal domain-containing protein [Pseudomonadota bacterium]